MEVTDWLCCSFAPEGEYNAFILMQIYNSGRGGTEQYVDYIARVIIRLEREKIGPENISGEFIFHKKKK